MSSEAVPCMLRRMTNDSSSPGNAPLGGRTGATIVAIVPLIAAILFLILGFAFGAWAWAWVFFLAIPLVALIVYGPTRR